VIDAGQVPHITSGEYDDMPGRMREVGKTDRGQSNVPNDGPNDRTNRTDGLSAGRILVAYEKLFGGGRGVKRYARSGLRYVDLGGGAVLVEQNPRKQSEWAALARQGHRLAWALGDGEYLARVVDGEVVMLGVKGV